MNVVVLVLVGLAAVALLVALAKFLALPVWAQASAVGLPVGFREIIGMRLRRTDPASIVLPAVVAKVAGITVDLSVLEAHYMAGGRVQDVVNGLIEAKKSGENMTVQELAKVDLDGRDPVDWVRNRPRRPS